VIGEDVPIVGGYCFGQFLHVQQSPQFLNQHLAILLFAEA
jgi:hypothetical protein